MILETYSHLMHKTSNKKPQIKWYTKMLGITNYNITHMFPTQQHNTNKLIIYWLKYYVLSKYLFPISIL